MTTNRFDPHPGSMALAGNGAAPVFDHQENGAAVAAAVPVEAAPAPPLSAYLHSFRRHWFVGAMLGLICAAAAGIGTYIGYGPRYESMAAIRVAALQDYIVFPNGGRADPLTEFEIFKTTQTQLIKGRYVLGRALDTPEAQALNIKERERDPVQWLSDYLIVRFPGRSEIMEVSFVSTTPRECKVLVAAVVNTYLNDVVGTQDNLRKGKIDKLMTRINEKQTEIRGYHEQARKLSKLLGASDKETLVLRHQVVINQLADLQRQLGQVQYELSRASGELEASRATLAGLSDMEISQFEVESEVRNDPIYRAIADELAWRRMDLAYTQSNVSAKSSSTAAGRFQGDLQRVQQQYDEMQMRFREGIRDMRRTTIARDMQKQEVQVQVLGDLARQLRKDVAAKQDEVNTFSSSSTDLEMLRGQVQQADTVLDALQTELQKLQIEQDSPNRVTLLLEPRQPDVREEFSPMVRYALSALAMICGFCLPVGLIVWADSRKQCVNGVDCVSWRAGLPVAGTMPLIPARVVPRLASQPRGYRAWRMRVTEAVDGVMARLMRDATSHSQSVLVTSAVGGEGKTTIATQLAMSLSRNGRRTVLLDFNLRRPSLNRVFGLAKEPGVCDALRGESDILELVHQRSTDEPAVVTAGAWDRAALAALAQGGAKKLLDQLHKHYEFVILDSSPVLPIADTRFLSQYADTVLMAVFRDISQVPKLQAAHDILLAFGATRIEAVVTGAADHFRDRDLGLEAQLKS